VTAPDVVARRIGREAQPVAIVDHFHPDPDSLRQAAGAAAFEQGRHHYPGIRAALPDDYFAQVGPALRLVLREVFGQAGGTDLIDASFSIVTTPASALSVPQRLPHVDAVEPNRIALVHYLAPEGGDGTAFYRHRATGFETLDARRAPIYFGQVEAELRRQLPPSGYMNGDTPLFEQVDRVPARYNRAVLYRSMLLHSGAISPDAPLSADPGTGRLTVTAFLSAS
jgi:hypothetical protein